MAKIMIVDDDVALADDTAAFLKSQGHTLALADQVDGALEKVRAFQPDLLILDMMFPENPLGGFAIASAVRHDRELQQLPIILLTGVNQHFPLEFPTNPKEDCRPIQDFIEKPVALPELLSRVNEVLNLKA